MANNCIEHELVIKPFAWLKPFGEFTRSEIETIRQEIVDKVRARELEYRLERKKAGQRILGADALREQLYMKPHKPKEKGRKIFIICSNKERRLELIALFKRIFAKCRNCYKKLKKGIKVSWPKGTFIPWLPPKHCRSLPSC